MRNIILLILLLATSVCHAQSYKLFTTDQELSSSLINHIYQDSNGMIWVATEDGLHRYDGAKFTIYKHHPEDNYSLSHNYVRRIFEDSQATSMWALTMACNYTMPLPTNSVKRP